MDLFATRVSEKLRWVRAGLRQSRAGPRGSGRARVVEFSLNCSTILDGPIYHAHSVHLSRAKLITHFDDLYAVAKFSKSGV